MGMIIDPYRFAVSGPTEITFVGSTTANLNSSNETFSLTSLTGGSGSAAAVGDFVVVAANVTRTLAPTITMASTGYTLEVNLSSADNSGIFNDLRVWYKRLTLAETSVTIDTTAELAVVCHVFRGVNASTPLDVTTTTATGSNTGRADPPAITPATAGTWVYAVGGGGYTATGAFTSSDLANFASTSNNNTTFKPQCGAGTFEWTSGSFDPAQFGGGDVSTIASWAAASLALRSV